jgi:hypothetical protein
MALMESIKDTYRKIELFFGNAKFAVVIITIFATYLGYGTFMESYHGTEYANRLVYKSIPFMMLQFLMFLSIVFATLIRLPPKKHLYGFYVIHAGLIVLFLGSFITYQAGVDGSLTLVPNLPNRDIQLSEDELKIGFPSRKKDATLELPFRAGEVDLDLTYESIRIREFFPFAEDELAWTPVKIEGRGQTSARYRLYNQNFGEFITLSLHPKSDFNNTTQLGLLNVHYMPVGLQKCFASQNPEGLIVWNGEDNGCMSPGAGDIKKFKGVAGRERIELLYSGQKISFLPEMSPLPLDESGELNEKSPFRIFSKKLFEKSPHLFVFGEGAAWYDKNTGVWESKPIKVNDELELPWMGFKLRLLNFTTDSYPTMTPKLVKPIQDQGQTVVGNMKAVRVEVDGESFWVRSTEPVAFNKNGERITFQIAKKIKTLRYELVLDQFKMDTDPGTQNPASFESFVTLFKGTDGSEKHHIFMNNPLKHQDFTFYQASYFPTEQGPMGSILSVNYDPGRFWKYLGSLLLVLGSIWHYVLRRKHMKKPGTI